MQVLIDHGVYGIEVPPSVPLWFLLPFIICLAAMPLGGASFGRLYTLSGMPLWMQALALFGVFKFLTFMPFGFAFSLFAIPTMANSYALPVSQTLAMLALTLISYGAGAHFFRKNLIRA